MTIRYAAKSSSDHLREDLQTRDRSRRRHRAESAAVSRAAPPARNDLIPDCPRVVRKLAELTPAARKVRKVTPAQVSRVSASIAQFGFVVPMLITSKGGIVDGHVRLEAARRMGIVEAPCLIVDHLTETELRALTVTLNRTAETGEWDLEVLGGELAELVAEGFSDEVLGFSLQEIDGILSDDDEPSEPAIAEGPPVTQQGDAWRLGKHRIICGDARDPEVYKTLMDSGLARLVLTDEPYNVAIAGHVTSGSHREFAMASGEMTDAEFKDFNLAWMSSSAEYLMDGGLFATFIDWRSVDLVIGCAKSLDLAPINFVVWAKTNAGMGSLWRSQHELLPIFKKGSAAHINNVELGKHGRYRSNLWTYPGANTFGSDASQALADHPTPKPVQLLEDALRDVTERGDIVLEPFLGSGSMLIAAERTGRRCRAIELDAHYVDLAIRRWEDLTNKAAMHEETGETFAATAAKRLSAATASLGE